MIHRWFERITKCIKAEGGFVEKVDQSTQSSTEALVTNLFNQFVKLSQLETVRERQLVL